MGHLLFVPSCSNNFTFRRPRVNVCTCHFVQKKFPRLSFLSQLPSTKHGSRRTKTMTTTTVVGAAPDIEVPEPLLDSIIETAENAIEKANPIILHHYRANTLSSSYKEDESPVTIADRDAEAIIIDTILSEFPHHSVLGEESGRHGPVDAEILWVVDPLDGTKAFVGGRPTFTTLIAVLWNGTPVVSIISQPVTRERWVGVIGRGTTLNGTPVSVSQQVSSLSDISVHATTPDMFVGTDAQAWNRLLRTVRHPVYGGDAYAYASMATGAAHVVVEADLKPWDFLALVPVVQAAGGYICDWYGHKLNMESDGRVIAAPTQELLAEILENLECDIVSQLERDITPVSEPILRPTMDTLPQDPGPNQIESMTGFGIGRGTCGNMSVAAELRSFNGRNANVKIRGARLSLGVEHEFSTIVLNTFLRGKIDIYFKVSSLDVNGGNRFLGLRIDKNALSQAKRLLSEVAQETGITDPPSYADFASFSDIFTAEPTDETSSNIVTAAREALMKGITSLKASRRREGAFLQEDVQQRVKKIRGCVDEIEGRAPGRVEEMTRRLKEMLSCSDEDEKLQNEIVLFANKVDISEEISRLREHVNTFDLGFYGEKEPIGQRQTYYVIEMVREANTIAAKASNAAIVRMTVLIREELEKIREQCQNIC